MGCEADDIGDADRVGIDARGDQAGHVGDIGEQKGADLIGDAAISRPISGIGVTAEAANNQARFALSRELAYLVVIKALGLGVDGVACDIVIDAAAVHRAAMRQVAAHDQVHAHDGVAGIEQRAVYGVVGRRARERLYVDVEVVRAQPIRGEQLGSAAARQRFQNVGVLGSFVVALVGIAAELRQALFVIQDFALAHRARIVQRIALGVNVVKGRADGVANGEGHGALRRNQNQFFLLPRRLVADQFSHIRVQLIDAPAKEKVILCHGWKDSCIVIRRLRFYHGNWRGTMRIRAC